MPLLRSEYDLLQENGAVFVVVEEQLYLINYVL